VRRLTTTGRNSTTIGFPSFSRDGKWIYFSRTERGSIKIWKIPASGGDAVQLTQNVGRRALESPGGACLYYVEGMVKASPLWCLPTSGGVPVKLLVRLVQGAFAALAKGIYYIDRTSGETRLQYFDLATRRSTTIATNLGNTGPFLTVSAEGRTILYSWMDSSVDDLMLVENFR
jgi:hypothetical protein